MTAEPSRMRLVRPAIAASTISGDAHGEVGAVVLADADGIDADFIGEDRLIDEIADHLRGVKRLAVGAVGDVAEGIEAEGDGRGHKIYTPLAGTSGNTPI